MFGRNKNQPRPISAAHTSQARDPSAVLPSSTPAASRDHRDYSVLESVNGDGTVLIGRGTKIIGEIQDCSKVEVQGQLEGHLVADSVIVREGGVLKGGLTAAQAEIHGHVEGEINVEGLLDVRATGQVFGDLTYGTFAVAAGGDVSGSVNGQKLIESHAQQTSAATEHASSPATMTNGNAAPQSLSQAINGHRPLG